MHDASIMYESECGSNANKLPQGSVKPDADYKTGAHDLFRNKMGRLSHVVSERSVVDKR